jgi:hypothetical protein
MHISANGKVLATATKDLSRRWQETREAWQDAKADEFARNFLVEFCAAVERAVPVFEELDKVVTAVRNQCE